uniref:Uncharacterized protein n=1 Tax=Cucumis melo TaxID=3656 RepID=A0A9I9E8E3_CUCME
MFASCCSSEVAFVCRRSQVRRKPQVRTSHRRLNEVAFVHRLPVNFRSSVAQAVVIYLSARNVRHQFDRQSNPPFTSHRRRFCPISVQSAAINSLCIYGNSLVVIDRARKRQ